ncbi:MAG TPA: DUF4124 domain-containing protein [Ramlibacter sp.]|uniref:DUF4124 domain-containing protein n=1 Tax=Ramlibacter sp. TaxID=1917967 RepID=UPI002ED01DA0
MKAARLALLALACSLPLAAAAQWQWLDNSGRKVFSDQPPPPDIAPNRIVKTGRGAAATAIQQQAAATEAPAAAAAATSLPKPSGKDKDLEAKKKEKEAGDQAKKKADEEKIAATRTENCSRAKNAKATFDSGLRVVRTNDKGEREFMDEGQRAAEVKHLNDIIARDCAK